MLLRACPKSLKVPGDAAGMPNPYVEVECLGEKRTTQVISGASACTFNNFYRISSSCVCSDFLKFESDGMPVEMTLVWDAAKSPPMPNTKYILHRIDCLPDNILMDFHVDAETLVLPLLHDDQPVIRVIEMFSGGVGGWYAACSHIHDTYGATFATLALEHDIEAALAFSISHDTPIVNGWKPVSPDLASVYQNLLVHTDISGDNWIELASAWKADAVLISSPCQPWSTAGSSAGLASEQGQLLLRAIAICKLLRPRLIGIEQVSGFSSHEHFRLIIQSLRWAGYALHHAQTIDAADVLPISRARWIAIAIRVNDSETIARPFQSWKPNKGCTPKTWGAIVPDDLLEDSLFPSQEVLHLSARHELLPPAKRRMISKEQVLQSRCTDGSVKVQTLMASYGTQHCFSIAWLEERGLLNHFVLHPTKGPRYWHPIELWLMHGVKNKQMLLHPFEKAFKHLGNQICVPHALVGIVNMLNCLKKGPGILQVDEVIAQFLDSRITAASVHTCRTGQGIVVAGQAVELSPVQHFHVQNFHQDLVEGSIPHGHVWTIDGLQEISTEHVPPTIPFPTFEKTQLCISGLTYEIWIQHGIPQDQILSIWDHSFMMLPCHTPAGDQERILVPCDKTIEENKTTKVQFIRLQQATYVVLPTPEVFAWFSEQSNGLFRDEANRDITQGGHPSFPDPNSIACCGFKLSQPGKLACSVAKFFHANRQCQFESIAVQSRFHVTLLIRGPPEFSELIAHFWHSLLTVTDLAYLGLHSSMSHTQGTWRLMWEVNNMTCPWPVHALKRLIIIRAFQAILYTLQSPDGIPAKIKLFGHSSWEGLLPATISIATLQQALHSVTWITFQELQFRVICQGRQQLPEFTVAEAASRSTRGLAIFHFVLQMHGGGYENGTKAGHRTQIKNALAATLLEQGHDLTWTSKSVDQVMQQAGQKELSKILSTDQSRRFKLACDFLTACNIPLPKINPGKSSQAAAAAKKKKIEVLPDPRNYRALDGMLKNEDGTNTAHLPTFGGQMQGYHMCTPPTAIPWMKQGEILSKDELILLVFGDMPMPIPLPHERITLPCTDEQGRSVLVACTMIQCGDKKVTVQKGDGHSINADDTILTSVTWWKEDWPTKWDEICQNPYKSLRNFPGVSEILVSVWGKSYRNGKSATTPNAATSIQVHCLMKEDKFAAFLKLSGYNALWLCPKTKEGRPHDKWRIIWLDAKADLQQATVLAAKLPDAAGLIKQQGRLALRIPKNVFADSWKIINPTTPMPSDVETTRIFKIENLPFGVTKSMVDEWALHHSWKIRPLRAMGPRAWVIGTSDEPPPGPLLFNGNPILVRELQNRTQPQSTIIIAGPKPLADQVPRQSTAIGPLMQDPWASYTGPKPHAPAMPAQANNAAPNVGPTEQQFAQQAERLTKLEDAVQQMQLGAANQTASIENLQLENHKRDIAIRSHIDERMNAMKQEMSLSFAEAIKQQSQQFNSNLDEIKNLLRNKPKRKKAEEAEDMSAIEYNSDLLSMALSQVDLIPLPYVILGDFNMKVEQFQSWELLASRGCRSLDQIHQRIYARAMDPTCRDSTLIDNAILSPSLVPLVTQVKVLENTWFATHRPVMFQITLPGDTLFAHHIRFPKSFVELDVPEQAWANMQDSSGDLSNATTIEEWGKAVENNVHHLLLQGQGNRPFLDKSFRGRCQPVKFVKCPVMSPVKRANEGSYEPSTEVLTIRTRRQITQVRRLESLARRLTKVTKDHDTSDKTAKELQQEWAAILRSHAFGEPFLHWVLSWPNMEWPQWPLPTDTWMYAALQIARYHSEISLKEDEAIRRRKLELARDLDSSANHQQAFATVRGPGMPRVFEIGRSVSFHAMAVEGAESLQYEIFADADDLNKLDPKYPIAISEKSGQILELETYRCLVSMVEPIDSLADEVSVVQQQFVMAPGDVAKQLDQFWKPIWQRDNPSMEFLQHTAEHLNFHELFSQLPPHPDIQVNPTDQETWQRAIKKLKPKAAKGTDLISAQEIKMLPWHFIHSLAAILATYTEGFPSSFMHGLICPLSKVEDIPMPSQTRPITLLPQIYRIWAAAMTMQLTKVLCAWIPLEVTGLLPRPGATATAYLIQFMIEQARKAHQIKSGLTLDLIKCFNCLRWDFCFHAMHAVGIPKTLLVQWIKSLQTLTRHWLLQNEIHTAGHGTCGLPEGDQWSVVAMLTTATVWVTQVRQALHDQAGARLSAYADNWAWILSSARDHQPALAKTLKVTQAAGVSIDWNKTWCWSTCHAHSKLVQAEVQQLVPGTQIPVKTSAADLGYQLQYNGNNNLGILSTRLEKGFQRLARLHSMPHRLSTKEAMVRVSIFPAALHGADIKPPATDAMLSLRSKTARALFGDSANLSPAIALACTKGSILDPEFWLILRALANARNFITQQPQAVQESFFFQCSRFRGSLCQVHGPAAALAFLLEKVDWKLDRHGMLHVNAFQKFPLLQSSMKRIERFLQTAWLDKLIIMHTAKTKMYHLPDMSRPETTAVLEKFKDSQRWLLIREISGAFQTASQKQKWLEQSDGLCHFCKQEDSREHRLLFCPIGTEIRHAFQDSIQRWIDEESLFPTFPVIHALPEEEALTLMHFQHAAPVWGQRIVDAAVDMHSRGIKVHWFTDGSCKFPANPAARHAAFAVILDLCHTDLERKTIAEQYRHAVSPVPTFQVACAARSTGEQDILRAETHAVLAIAEKFGFGIVHCDSQTAISNINRVLSAATPMEFLSCEHLDLLYRLWNIRHHISISLEKVKAHQEVSQVSDPLQRYWAMGNDLADRTAQSTCMFFLPDMVDKLSMLHQQITIDKRELETVYCLHLELQAERGRAEANICPGLSYNECGTMIQKLVEQVRSLVPQQVWPLGLEHGKQSSLFRLGAPKHFQGINRRPELPKQVEAMNMILLALSGKDRIGLGDTPPMDMTSKPDRVASGTWQHRASMAKNAMIKVRKARAAN
eukprot:s1111_g15.t1